LADVAFLGAAAKNGGKMGLNSALTFTKDSFRHADQLAAKDVSGEGGFHHSV
jgi:hypothetical protein